MRMSQNDYIRTQVKLVGIGRVLDELDLDAFVGTAVEAESAGATIDPTLYRRGIDSLVAIRQFAEAAQKLKAAFREVQRTVLARVEKEGRLTPVKEV